MKNITLIATSAFGLESILKRELINLGFTIDSVEDGKVTYTTDYRGLVVSNLYLRTADRVLLKVGEFEATTFDELFEKTKALPWEDLIPVDGKFTVNGKSIKSQLFSISDCQAIVKKSIVEKLKSKFNVDWFKEIGAEYTVLVSLLKDVATLTIDTSGVGLHKRGYRPNSVKAPIKETLAAAMVLLSFWNKDRLLLDPFCGSGTIPIEAAMIGRNIAPGLNRSFASENWEFIDSSIWKEEKRKAYNLIDQESDIKIYASDLDKESIEIAKESALDAGVDDCIEFSVSNFFNMKIKNSDYGVLITNPPYGERLGSKNETKNLYVHIGTLFKDLDNWSKYIITSNENFETLYGAKSDKKRKLFNGNIKTFYYQYYGKRPEKEK